MNQLEIAIYNTVHDYPGGTLELAEEMCMSRQILLNKACPTTENAYFSPQQLSQLQRITNNYAINESLRVMELQPKRKSLTVTESLLDITDKLGATVHEVNQAMSDHVMTDREKAACLKKAGYIKQSADELIHSLHNHKNALKAV